MGSLNCYNAAIEIINEASERFVESFSITDVAINRIEDVCAMVENLAQSVDSDYIDMNVDMQTARFSISVFCDYVELENGRTDEFFSLINKVDSFALSVTSDTRIQIEFSIDWIWEKKNEH